MPKPSTFIELDGQSLDSKQIAAIARGGVKVKVSPAGMERARKAHEAIKKIAKRRPVYGQSTGVGSNKSASVTKAETSDHGLNLLRSHAAGGGPEVNTELARAMLGVRLNQLAAGGSGVNPMLLDVLAEVINKGLTPPITRYGAVGTGDLTALSVAALCLMGEREWRGGTMPAFKLENTEALAFISSSAATLGEAALACHDLSQLLHASMSVTALSYMALGGSAEAYAEKVHDSRPYPGQIKVALEMRKLLGSDLKRPSRKIQDSYGLRVFPQVHGPALDAAEQTEKILQIQYNSSIENPLVSVEAQDIFHNGNFHTAYVGLALDTLRVALYSTASLSAARIATLMNPANTGLRPFLADGPEASSGLLILEYVDQSALADLRHLSQPDSIGSAVMSLGTEEHASFATQSAWHTTAAVPAYETILACEMLAAVRALNQQNKIPSNDKLKQIFDSVLSKVGSDYSDHPLDTDIAAAINILRKF